MDLRISGRLAIVCASSKGLGLGCAEELAANGVNLIMNARTADVLHASAQRLADTYGVTVTPVATDITTEAGRAEVLDAAAGQTVDILVNNAGGPPQVISVIGSVMTGSVLSTPTCSPRSS